MATHRSEDIAGDALARLRRNYTIRRSEVSGHIGLHFGPDPPKPGVETLQADVRQSSFPTNLVVATVFPLEGGDAILSTPSSKGDNDTSASFSTIHGSWSR